MSKLKILFLGDVYGSPGRKAVADYLKDLREEHGIDFVVANGENAAGGKGITPAIAKELYANGVDVITLGNHTWDQKEVEEILDGDPKLLRPVNYPPGTMGKGFAIYRCGEKKIAVVNLMGRLFMEPFLDCPFQWARNFLREHELGDDYDALIVDVHAEASGEKTSLGILFDGKASLVVGSHTHVPTADGRILPGGTGYQTDAGMCGAYDSCIGIKKDVALRRFEQKGRVQIDRADGDGTLCGVLVTIGEDGLCESLQPVLRGGILGADAQRTAKTTTKKPPAI